MLYVANCTVELLKLLHFRLTALLLVDTSFICAHIVSEVIDIPCSGLGAISLL